MSDLLLIIPIAMVGYYIWFIYQVVSESAKDETKGEIENAKEVDPLLPCPLCGSEVDIRYKKPGAGSCWTIECRNRKCGLESPRGFLHGENPKQALVSKWNTRVK